MQDVALQGKEQFRCLLVLLYGVGFSNLPLASGARFGPGEGHKQGVSLKT